MMYPARIDTTSKKIIHSSWKKPLYTETPIKTSATSVPIHLLRVTTLNTMTNIHGKKEAETYQIKDILSRLSII